MPTPPYTPRQMRLILSAIEGIGYRYGVNSVEHRFSYGFFFGHHMKLWLTRPKPRD